MAVRALGEYDSADKLAVLPNTESCRLRAWQRPAVVPVLDSILRRIVAAPVYFERRLTGRTHDRTPGTLLDFFVQPSLGIYVSRSEFIRVAKVSLIDSRQLQSIGEFKKTQVILS